MPIKVPSPQEVATKWQRRASGASKDYADGISRNSSAWAEPTAASAGNWLQSVTEAGARGAFAAGVNRAGNEKWARKARTLGATRFGSGITAAVPDYQAGMVGVLQVISGVDLPARGIRGSEANFSRSAAVGRALNEARVAGQLRN